MIHFFLLLLSVKLSYSQTFSIKTNEALNNLTNAVTKNSILENSNIKGSPYFSPKFALANIKYFDLEIIGESYLRYNAYSDEIEMGLNPNQESSSEALLKNNRISCSFAGEDYFYLPFIDKNNQTKLGYLIALHKGAKYLLLQQKRKIYREATIPRTSLERAFPARFTEEFNYYLGIEETTPVYIGNDFKEVVKNLPNIIKKPSKRKRN